jgi:hypothetical protein
MAEYLLNTNGSKSNLKEWENLYLNGETYHMTKLLTNFPYLRPTNYVMNEY